LHSFLLATQFDRHWYKAWHAWAIANFEVVNYYRHSDTKVYQHVLSNYVVPAVHGKLSYSTIYLLLIYFLGFFQSISLSSGNSLQDTLRLLTLWFEYGPYSEVNSAIAEGFSSVSIDNWLQVIPQVY
jgi:FKBP12-rapamycin complex-associated protein